MPDDTNHGSQDGSQGGSTGSGGEAGKVLQFTEAQLQSRIDREIQKALQAHVEKNQEKLGERDREIDRLKSEIDSAGKTKDELLESLKTQNAELKAELETVKASTTELQGRFTEMLTVEVESLGDEGKAKFESICPKGLTDPEKLVFLGNLKAQGVLSVEAAGNGEGEGNETEGQPGVGITPPQPGNPPGNPEGEGPTDFGAGMAQRRRETRESAKQGAIDPWAQQ